MAEMTREQFIEQVQRIIPEKFPLVKLVRGDAPFSLRVNGHVAPLENVYRAANLRPDELRHIVERWVVELIRAAEGTPDRNGSFDDLRERIFPMVVGERPDQGPRGVVTQPLVDGLTVAYAIDSDRTISYLLESHFKNWNITPDDLHAVAVENLVNKSESMNAHAAQDDDGRINLILFQTMDGYDASRLLLPTLHDRLREHLGSPFVAAVPNRDILLCFRNDDETIAKLKDQIADDYRQMPHQVTDKLLLVTRDGIAVRG